MSREIGTTNLAQANSSFVEPVLLAHFEFDEPVYVHSGVGIITWDGNDYVGVGSLGSIEGGKEKEVVGPESITFSLSGLDANSLREAMDAGSYGDRVTIWYGYRQEDGTLYEAPWIRWRGRIDSASIKSGPESVVSFTAHHRVADLDQINGGRFTDEDQQTAYNGDEFFEHISDVPTVRLLWGRNDSQTGRRPDSDRRRRRQQLR